MIRMSNVSRHRPADSLEWFYEEWHGEHVRIMREAPGVMRLLRRYVQNRALHDATMPAPPLPLGEEGWDAMSQLTFANAEDFIACFADPDYIEQVRWHQFSDPAVIVATLTAPETIFGSPQIGSEFKVVQFYEPAADVSESELLAALDGNYLAALRDTDGVAAMVRNRPSAAVSPEVFVGSRWEGVPFNRHCAFDEIYFADRATLVGYLTQGDARGELASIRDRMLAPSSFSFVCREILQIDNSAAYAKP